MNRRRKIYVFLNGDFNPPAGFPASPERDSLVVATDGGIRHVLALGWKPDVVLGDFDSAPPELAAELERAGTARVLRYPEKKDKTDYELALETALGELEPEGTIEVLGAFGGRLDMTLANLLLPGAESLLRAGRDLSPTFLYRDGETRVYVITGPKRLELPPDLPPDSLASLVPLSAEVTGATLGGNFLYPLREGTLLFGNTLGVSNAVPSNPVGASAKTGPLSVSIGKGTLAVFLAPNPDPDGENDGENGGKSP
ncbi:MAG: thiamine diphosphokinase [Deltaproteobacteria bacterium]|nr:thiamine diphosphokinase [Deltaproteobacteria bacterium]